MNGKGSVLIGGSPGSISGNLNHLKFTFDVELYIREFFLRHL